MRQRLDLDALLRKYETNYSPRQPLNEPAYLSPRNTQPKYKITKLKTQSNYYPENDLQYFNTVTNHPQIKKETYNRDKISSVNFQMSKSQCENLLMSMKEELNMEERGMQNFINDCILQLTDRFNRQHEQLRRELITLVEQSLEQNKRVALDLLEAYRKQFPRQYTNIAKKISIVNEEINSLLNGLNSSTYRKTIAEVVTKDFTDIVKRMREEIATANTHYQGGLVGVELDRAKLARIQESLHNLYVWKNKEDGLKLSDERDDFMRQSRKSSKRKIFEHKGMEKMAMTQRNGSEKSAPKHMRRTFFNFDSNN